MKSAKGYLLVLVTAPDLKVGRQLARACCKSRMAACVNLVPGLESHYWWEGKLQKSSEVFLLIKTRRGHLKRLEQLITEEHPYDTPEIISIPVSQGSEKYLSWWSAASSLKT